MSIKNRYRQASLFAVLEAMTSFMSDDLVQDFKTYTHSLPTEKVYLHLNKHRFTTQESVWFKRTWLMECTTPQIS